MSRLVRRGLALALVVAVVLGVVAWLHRDHTTRRHVIAQFASATGLHVGDPVQVLGVDVGRVEKIVPGRDHVLVTMDYRIDGRLAADARAVITEPSLVPVRAVELGPVRTGAAAPMSEGAVIPQSRTAVPVEWDEVKTQVSRLSRLLGPHGANSSGALSRLVASARKNLHGRGNDIAQTLDQMARALRTLDDSRGDLFATVGNLQIFVKALAGADDQVATFNKSLATTAAILDDNTGSLSKALRGLDSAYDDLTAFLRTNRPALRSAVGELRPVLDVLADRRQDIADLLQIAPTSLSNIYNIYEPLDGSITGAFVVGTQPLAPAQWLCGSIIGVGGAPALCSTLLGPLVQATTQQLPLGISAVERNGRSNQIDMRGSSAKQGRK